MTYPYVVNVGERLVRVTLSGTVTGRDIADTMESIYSNPGWQRGFDIVWDGIAATTFALEREDHSAFVSLQYRFNVAPGGRDILVIPRTTDFKLARRYTQRASGSPREVLVVRAGGEADHILGRHLKPDRV